MVSFGSQCAPLPLRRVFLSVRWPLVLVVLILAASARGSMESASQSDNSGNAMVALVVGIVCLLCVMLVGSQSGGRRVAISVPLMPGLALFALLNLVEADPAIERWFMVFFAAALYVLCYERFLEGVLRSAPGLRRLRDGAAALRLPGRAEVTKWAGASVLAGVSWMLLLATGGAALYYPILLGVPKLIAPELAKLRAATADELLDFRQAASVMELHGGNYPLSGAEVMRVTVVAGEPSGLWKGRFYDRYERSRWEATNGTGSIPSPRVSVSNARFVLQRQQYPPLPELDRSKGVYRHVVEVFEPLTSPSTTIFASGIITRVKFRSGAGVGALVGYLQPGRSYQVDSAVVIPNAVALLRSRGLTAQARRSGSRQPRGARAASGSGSRHC